MCYFHRFVPYSIFANWILNVVLGSTEKDKTATGDLKATFTWQDLLITSVLKSWTGVSEERSDKLP